MATLDKFTSLNGTATAHTVVQTTQTTPSTAAVATGHRDSALPADGEVLAESVVYRTINKGLLSHTDGLVVRQSVVLKLVPDGSYQLLVTPSEGHMEEYLLDPADWELRPKSINEIAPSVHTLKAAGDTNKEVVMAGEFEGEDLPLYDIEIHYKGGLKNALLHPNQPGPAHKLEKGQHKLVRIGFEQQLQAQEWYALLSIAMGLIDLDSPTLASLPTALAASRKAHSFKA